MVDITICENIKEDIKTSGHFWLLSEYITHINPYDQFISWEAGFSSTERNNKARVKKVLNALDTLNQGNLEHGSEFFANISMAIKEFMDKAGYDIKSTEKNSYSITRKKHFKVVQE